MHLDIFLSIWRHTCTYFIVLLIYMDLCVREYKILQAKDGYFKLLLIVAMFVCLSVERGDLGRDLYHATNAVTRLVQCHLKDCSNLLAIYDKQKVLWTNFINPDPHATCKCLFWKPIINLIGIHTNSHHFQHKTAFYWDVFFITYSTFKY